MTDANKSAQAPTLPTVVLTVNQAWNAWKFRGRLIQFLREQGFRLVVLTDCTTSAEKLAPLCDELVHVPIASARIDPLADLRTLARYWREFRRLRPFAVLTFTIKPNIYASLAARLLHIPVISNVTGLGTMHQQTGWLSLVVRRLYVAAFRRAHWVFFQNPEDADALTSRGLVVRHRTSLLPGSGVDTERYRPANESARKGPVRFCMVARLLRDKGVAEFAEAASALRSAGTEAQFDLWGILDAGDPRYVTAEEIAEWEARGALKFHGEVADSRVAFESADVAVLPSYYPEGLPRTLLEASAMALPAITTDTPGCRDAVVHGQTGLLCQPRDAGSLADAMRAMLALSEGQRLNMGNAARRRAVESFDETRVLRAYLDKLHSAREERQA
jgi:glycosyltransferase involved in cell wall biosynthesis